MICFIQETYFVSKMVFITTVTGQVNLYMLFSDSVFSLDVLILLLKNI